MSRIDFTSFRNEYPGLATALELLQAWQDAHPNLKFLEPGRIAHEVGGASPADLAMALGVLAGVGRLKMVFRVRPPTGRTELATLYTSPEAIPHELRDTFQRKFELDDAEVVPGFVTPEVEVHG